VRLLPVSDPISITGLINRIRNDYLKFFDYLMNMETFLKKEKMQITSRLERLAYH